VGTEILQSHLFSSPSFFDVLRRKNIPAAKYFARSDSGTFFVHNPHLGMSDAISRHKVQEALELGWTEIEMDWGAVYHILARATKDFNQASTCAKDLVHHFWDRDVMARDSRPHGSTAFAGFGEPEHRSPQGKEVRADPTV